MNAENNDTSDGGWEEHKQSMEAKGYDPVASAQVEAFDANMKGFGMNTEQVVEMIDAITEGKRYTLNVPGDELNASSASFDFLPDGRIAMGITVPGLFSFIDNPRTAREIAGALVAWANRRESGFNELNNQRRDI